MAAESPKYGTNGTSRTNGTRYSYYLVWITSLGGIPQVAINELALYR